MTQPARLKSESNIYHVVNRGVGKQIIFENDDDKALYYNMLVLGCESYPVRVYAWCLMDNHVHLLLKGEIEQISAFMRYVQSTYAKGFNSRYGRSGHLFENRFKSEPIETDAHLLAAVRYIHQNPQKAGMASAQTYKWSSYSEYAKNASPTSTRKLTDTSFVLDVFESVDDFVSFHMSESRDGFLEPDDSKASADNKRALRIVLEELGERGMFELRSLPKEERNAMLVRLIERGLTLRQIERFTGVSKSQISRLNGTKLL